MHARRHASLDVWRSTRGLVAIVEFVSCSLKQKTGSRGSRWLHLYPKHAKANALLRAHVCPDPKLPNVLSLEYPMSSLWQAASAKTRCVLAVQSPWRSAGALQKASDLHQSREKFSGPHGASRAPRMLSCSFCFPRLVLVRNLSQYHQHFEPYGKLTKPLTSPFATRSRRSSNVSPSSANAVALSGRAACSLHEISSQPSKIALCKSSLRWHVGLLRHFCKTLFASLSHFASTSYHLVPGSLDVMPRCSAPAHAASMRL